MKRLTQRGTEIALVAALAGVAALPGLLSMFPNIVKATEVKP